MERICFFDSWACWSLVGRTVAAVSELCYVAQMAYGLIHIGRELHTLSLQARPEHVKGPFTSRCALSISGWR